MQTINKHIHEDMFKQVYLLYGSEAYLKRTFKNKLKEGILQNSDDINYSYFEGKNLDINKVSEIAQTLPFFSERRLIILEHTEMFKNTADRIVNIINNLPATTHIIFMEETVDKRNKLYKAVNSMGYAAELSPMDMASLYKWISGILKKENMVMSRETIEYFIHKIGTDMENILAELEKLICYSWGSHEITISIIDDICSTHITNKIFDMVAAVAEKNCKLALNLYYDLLTLKEPPIKILFLITRQFNYLLQVKELVEKRMSGREIASKLKIQLFIVDKYIKQCKKFTIGMLRIILENCISTDEAIKTGKMADTLAVELLIVRTSE